MGLSVPVGMERRLLRPPAAAVFTEAELDGLPTIGYRALGVVSRW
jgi:hypothetical protein